MTWITLKKKDKTLVAVMSWFPFMDMFRSRLLFNQSFSRENHFIWKQGQCSGLVIHPACINSRGIVLPFTSSMFHGYFETFLLVTYIGQVAFMTCKDGLEESWRSSCIKSKNCRQFWMSFCTLTSYECNWAWFLCCHLKFQLNRSIMLILLGLWRPHFIVCTGVFSGKKN